MYDFKKIGCLWLVVYDPAWAALFKAKFIDIWYIYIYRSHNLVYKIYCRNRPRAKTSLDCPSIQATRFKIPVWLLIFFSGCIHSFRVYLVRAVLITSIPKSTSSLVIHIGGLIRNTCKAKKKHQIPSFRCTMALMLHYVCDTKCPSGLRTLCITLWLGFLLRFVSGRHFVTSIQHHAGVLKKTTYAFDLSCVLTQFKTEQFSPYFQQRP